MLAQSGLSRELFDAWCEDRRNGVIIADFAVQGTLAREILASPSHVITKAGARVRARCMAPAAGGPAPFHGLLSTHLIPSWL